MRRIVSTIDVNHSHGKVDKTPVSGVYSPNYHGLNQALHQVGGQGEVSFYDALARESRQKVEKYREVYGGLELGDAAVKANAEYMQRYNAIRKEDPSGAGFLEKAIAAHHEIYSKYGENLSDPELQQKWQIMQQHGLMQASNQAFQEQISTTKAYAVNQNMIQLETFKNQVIKNPDSFETISMQYREAMKTMGPVLPAIEKVEYERKKWNEFMVSFAVGLRNKDPVKALELYKGDMFVKELSAEQLGSLISGAKKEQHHRTVLALKYEKMMRRAFERNAVALMSRIDLAKAFGQGNAMDMLETAYANHQIDEVNYNKKLIEWHKQDETEKKEDKKKEALLEHLKTQTPAPEISADTKTKVWNEYVQGENQRRESAGEEAMSFTEQTLFLEKNAVAFDSPIPFLKSSLASVIRRADVNTDGKRLLDACVAVVDNGNAPAIRGMDQDVKDFARYAVDAYKTNQSLEEIKKAAVWYFTPQDSAANALRDKEWKDSDYSKSAKTTVGNFLKNAGFGDGGWWGWFQSISPLVKNSLQEEAYGIIQRVYKRSGSFAIAESVALQTLRSRFGTTEINGEEQPMVDPPEKANGLPYFVNVNFVAGRGQMLVKDIEKAGDKYLGDVKVRMSANQTFIPPESERKIPAYFQKPLTRFKSRPVEALINGEWKPRNLNIEPVGTKRGVYAYYVLADEKDSNSKIYLLDPRDNQWGTVNLSPERLAQIRGK
jgi:hypothetical protein